MDDPDSLVRFWSAAAEDAVPSAFTDFCHFQEVHCIESVFDHVSFTGTLIGLHHRQIFSSQLGKYTYIFAIVKLSFRCRQVASRNVRNDFCS